MRTALILAALTACSTGHGDPPIVLPDADIRPYVQCSPAWGIERCDPECADRSKVGTHTTPMGACFLPGLIPCHNDERVGANDEGCCHITPPLGWVEYTPC